MCWRKERTPETDSVRAAVPFDRPMDRAKIDNAKRAAMVPLVAKP